MRSGDPSAMMRSAGLQADAGKRRDGRTQVLLMSSGVMVRNALSASPDADADACHTPATSTNAHDSDAILID